MIRNLLASAGASSKCRTVDKLDIFGDGSGVALYRLDGNANDESGNYHGTETAITYGGGAYERGAVFNGSSSRINFSAISGAQCISFWTNKAIINEAVQVFFGSSSLIAHIFNGEWTAGMTSETFGAWYVEGGTNKGVYITDIINNTTWKHIVIQFVSTGVYNIWVNGVSRTVNYYTAGTAIGNFIPLLVSMGQYNNGAANWLNASIDQIRFFNRALTATEVATLYAECAPTSTVDNINPFEDGSLKALYQFNGDATDKTGVYNGIVTGTPTYTTGKFGNALVSSNIANDFVTTANIPTGNIKTISIWIYPTALPTDSTFHTIYGAISSTTQLTNSAIIRYVSAGLYALEAYFNSGDVRYYASTNPQTSIPLNTWTHFIFTLESDNKISVYKNGTTLVKSTATTSGSVPYTGSINFGQYNPNGSYNSYTFRGNIGQVRIFNKALTPMEVAALYNETTPLEEPMHSLVDPFKDGSGKALYRLDGNALDESGNYNGTATSVTYGAGRFGRAGVFGDSKYIDVSSLTATALGSIVTVSMWFKKSVGDYEWLLTLDGRREIYWGASGLPIAAKCLNQTGASGGAEYADNTWHHVVAIFNGYSNTSIYIDGVWKATDTSAGTQLNTGTRIGGYPTLSTTYCFGGSIDQVRIFNRALTASEITALYTEI